MDNVIRYPCPGCAVPLEIILGSLATEADRTERPPCYACRETAPALPERVKTILRCSAFASIRAARAEILKLPWAAAWLAEGEQFLLKLQDAHPPKHRAAVLKVWLGAPRRLYTRARSLAALHSSAGRR